MVKRKTPSPCRDSNPPIIRSSSQWPTLKVRIFSCSRSGLFTFEKRSLVSNEEEDGSDPPMFWARLWQQKSQRSYRDLNPRHRPSNPEGRNISSLIKHYAVMTYCQSGGWLHTLITSALERSEWPASRPDCFTSGTHWIGGWVSPRPGLDVVVNRKKSHHCPCQELNPGRPARSYHKSQSTTETTY
jgi:hypothetical protein